ncbi:hypothetical protein SY88_20460 [Clostridiales bacterium PH28_bin88]|nr:hypothetical protein SY88_20460 [Clostridiales bacterium PH28_bin88]
MRKKGFVLFVIALLMVSLLAGCGGKQEQPSGKDQGSAPEAKPVTLRLGHVVQEKTALHKGALKLAEEVKAKSNGQIIIEVYPASALGGNRELIESVQSGAVDMALPAMAILSGFTNNKTAIFDLPYLWKNESAAEKVLDGPIGQSIFDEVKKSGILGLAYWTQGWRHVTNDKKPIRKPEDLKGMKIRTMENPLHMAHFNTLGASAVPMAFSEVYTSLQQKVIDGQENPYVNIVSMGFYEVQRYITETGHIYDPVPLLMSEITWKKLSPEQQKIIADTVKEITNYERELSRQDAVEYKKQILATGKNEIIELTPEERQAFRDAAQPVYDSFQDKELLQKVLDAQKDM